MKNARTPLMHSLRKAMQISRQSSQTGIPSDELIDMHGQHLFSRRDFIGTSVKAGAAIGLASTIPFLTSCRNNTNNSNDKYSIAIIGGGIAGLHAAWILKKKNIKATVYEGSGRTGGRMLSAHNVMGNNLTTEYGGEYIDTDHENMIALARDLELKIMDTLPSLNNLKIDDFFIGGKHHTVLEAISEFSYLKEKIESDANAAKTDTTGVTKRALDAKSIDEYLDSIGSKGWFRKLLQVAYESEYGYATAEQSSLNLINFIDTNTCDNEFRYFGSSDERYKILGGNQQIVDKLAYQLKDSVQRNYILSKIKSAGNGYTLSFSNGKEINADFVIMTIPFSMLREVDMNEVKDMSSEKKNAIRNLKYGTNAKIMFGFKKRIWREQGFGGYSFNEIVQNGWDNSVGQNDNCGYGGYTVFLGGKAGAELNTSQYDMYLDGIDKMYPGAKALHDKKHRAIMHWPTQPFVKGSYAVLTTGDCTSLAPHIAPPAGNIYFAGEHCSKDFQGFMEGGAETGKSAALAVLEKIGVHSQV